MHFRPNPKGYMRGVTPVINREWTIKNSTLFKKVLDKQYDVCVVCVNKLLGKYEKEIIYGDEAIEKATNYLKPFKHLEETRTCERFRKRERLMGKDVEEIFDWDYYLGTDNYQYTYIALKKKE